jgi:Xaa-Pro aminopeptidase
VDPTVITSADARRLAEALKKAARGSLVGVKENLVDRVWGADRPARPVEKVQVLSEKYSGKDFRSKLEDLRKVLDKKEAAGIIISMLDEVAWLFNLRSCDIPYNPVFFSYAAITPTTATIYVDPTKLTSEVNDHLGTDVETRPYDSLLPDLTVMSQSMLNNTDSGATDSDITSSKKYLVSTKASWALSLGLGGEERVNEVRSPVGDSKAVKNKTELEGMRSCHIRDGVALIKYFAWLENTLVQKGETLDEVQAADKLLEIRSEGAHFVGLSFDTISSTGPNAAVIHYQPERGNCSVIDPKAIYLCDSGAQYLDGTTDTTRTLHFGEPKEMEIKAYTLVLKGVISLDRAIFPKGTSGFALDSFARQHLWREGLDYRHGTGHGVGSYLVGNLQGRTAQGLTRIIQNVHEGPIGIGTRSQYSEVQLSAGNVLSDGMWSQNPPYCAVIGHLSGI